MKYKLINYHCRHCGAPVEPGQERCSYCDQIANYQKFIGGKNHLLTLLIDTDNDFVNFNEITQIDNTPTEPESIDVTCLEDCMKREIIRRSAGMFIYASMPLTLRGIELQNKLKKDIRYRVRFEINGTNMAFETKSYIEREMPEISQNSIISTQLKFIVDDDYKWLTLEQPKGLTCPNCGAPIISRYGACGYCGGWLEYVS